MIYPQCVSCYVIEKKVTNNIYRFKSSFYELSVKCGNAYKAATRQILFKYEIQVLKIFI